ncbi:hypothetical protein RYX36_005834, partial [Vicia faba]
VRTTLDINYEFGSFGAHLLSLNIMAVCVTGYEANGNQVQFSRERGLPAVIGNFIEEVVSHALEIIIEEEHVAPKVEKVNDTANQVGQVKCGSCTLLLMYPYGASQVRCSSCRFVTEIG